MPDKVKMLLGIVIILFISSVVAAIFLYNPKNNNSEKSEYVEIVQDGKVIEKIDLRQSDDRTFKIECDNGWNEITICNGGLSVSDADCPDKICVKSGVLHSKKFPIVCLPHKLIIRFCEE